MCYDLIIKNVQIADGSGQAVFHGAVADKMPVGIAPAAILGAQ